ncbi:MAG: response regulator [Kiritimatiellae bacterium]|nr:response regulator [Kiritimatiellia bacterium]
MKQNADNQTAHQNDKAAFELERRLNESDKLAELAQKSRLALLDSLEDRNLAEKQLRDSEERFRSLYNSMNEGVALHRVVYDDTGKAIDYIVESVNPAYERILELKSSDVIGKTASVVYGTGVAPYLDIYVAVAENRIPAHFEIKHAPTGKIFKISVSSPGQGLFATVFEDITDSRRMADQLEKIQRMESVGRLAGGIAHDFNNMLSVILGNLEMVLEATPESDNRYHDLIEIRKAAQRSAELTRQLLAFARRQTVAPKLIDLNDTLAGMIGMMQRLLGEDINLVWQPSDNLWAIKIDPSQIDQILANMCVNARDAINGVGRLTIKTENTTVTESYCIKNSEIVPGDYVSLIVSDNGCGMTKDVLSHLFEPFFTTKHLSVGSGLGLATVYGIVKQNRGFINVYSESGLGTTFKIGIPRHYNDAAEPHTETSPSNKRSVRGGNETILLVEDEITILSMIQTMLGKLGYRVLAASSPNEAIELAEANKGAIDMLLSDVIMPDMDGLQLAERLKSAFPDMHCLFMSGYTAEVIINRGTDEKSSNFIQKPFSIQDLSLKIREVLDL